MQNKNHICFDLDGVLIESVDLMKYSWENTVNFFEIDINFEEFYKFIGLSLEDIVKNLELPNGYELIKYYKMISATNLDKIKVKEKTIENLENFSKNYKISIFTSKTQERVDKIIDLYFKSINFDSILTSDKVKNPKPDPEGLIKVCNLVNSYPEQTLYVGDTNYDFLASKKANIDFVYASWGYGEVENSKYKIENIEQLSKFL